MSDSGDRFSAGVDCGGVDCGGIDCGICAWTAATANSRSVVAPIAFTRTTVPIRQRAHSACRYELSRNWGGA